LANSAKRNFCAAGFRRCFYHNFERENVMQPNGNLFHNWKKGQASVDGFLEDYSLFIQSAISLFEVSRDEEWLNVAKKMTNYTFNNF
jgi:uncharacterized protein YyaL (SSP411 family)